MTLTTAALAARLAEVEYLVAVTGDYADKERRRAEAAVAQIRELENK